MPRATLAAPVLLALPLVLAACGTGGPAQVGQPPTRDWPRETECPPSVASICAGKRLLIFSTINEPRGTTYGIASTNEDVFVICRPSGVDGSTCAQVPPAGAQVLGEAAVYRVED